MKRTLHKLLAAALAFALAAAMVSPVAAAPFRTRMFRHATRSVGIPHLVPGAGFLAPTDTPPANGSPADFGFADQAICNWDTPPQIDLNNSFADAGVNDHLYVGVLAYHAPSAQEYIAGSVNNITEVDFSVDGGVWTPGVLTTNPDTGILEWVAEARVGDFGTDGQHETQAKCIPSTGVPLVLTGGPVVYPRADVNVAASFSGNVMTVSTASLGNGGTLKVGQGIVGFNIPNGTYIASFGTGTGTGTGVPGTYNLNQNVGTFASQTVSIATAQSLFFNTNASSTMRRMIVYIDDPTDPVHPGNNANSGLDSSHPVADMLQAATIANGTNSGLGGAVFCLMGSYAYAVHPVDTETSRATDTRWLHIQSVRDKPCDGVGAGTPQIAANDPGGTVRINAVHFKDISINAVGVPAASGTTGFFRGSGGATALWFDHVTFQGPGMNSHYTPDGSPGWAGGTFSTESSFSAFHDGPGGVLARNLSLDHIVSDGFSRTRTISTATSTFNSENYGHGDFVSGSAVVTNLDFDPRKVLTTGTATVIAGSAITNASCISGTSILSVDSATQITLSQPATATGTQLLFTACGEHPDLYQAGGTGQFGNVVIWNADASSPTNFAEGILWDNDTFGGVIYGSKWSPNPSFYVFQTSSKVSNLHIVNNDFGNAGLGIFFRTANGNVNTDVSLINDTCAGYSVAVVAGTTFRGGTCFH